MSELRRNRGPDGGDQPEKIAKVDNPQRRPSLEIRTSDQIEGREIDRREVTPAQRDFIRAEKQAAASGVPRKPLTTYSMDWESGDHVDGWYDPPSRDDDHDAPSPSDEDDDRGNLDHVPPGNTPAVRDSPYAEPPTDFHRDNAELEFRKLERTDAADAQKVQPMDTTRRRGRGIRGLSDRVSEKSEDALGLVKKAVDGADDVFQHPPGHATAGTVQVTGDHHDAQYGSPTDIATGALAGAFALVIGSSKVHEMFSSWKARHDRNG